MLIKSIIFWLLPEEGFSIIALVTEWFSLFFSKDLKRFNEFDVFWMEYQNSISLKIRYVCMNIYIHIKTLIVQFGFYLFWSWSFFESLFNGIKEVQFTTNFESLTEFIQKDSQFIVKNQLITYLENTSTINKLGVTSYLFIAVYHMCKAFIGTIFFWYVIFSYDDNYQQYTDGLGECIFKSILRSAVLIYTVFFFTLVIFPYIRCTSEFDINVLILLALFGLIWPIADFIYTILHVTYFFYTAWATNSSTVPFSTFWDKVAPSTRAWSWDLWTLKGHEDTQPLVKYIPLNSQMSTKSIWKSFSSKFKP